MSKRRVVITGIGTINAVGNNIENTWNNLVEGKSGIDYIKRFDTEGFAVKIAGEIKDYEPKDHFPVKEVKKTDRYTQFALIAAREAYEDAGLNEENYTPERAGCITGTGIGGMISFEDEAVRLHKSGPRRVSPFFIPKMISNIAAAQISIEKNLKAVCFNSVSACASANHAIGTAFRMIQYGDADLIFTGGSEAAVSPLALAGFSNMKALSTRNETPSKACSPFDSKRDGFIMAEGAGILVLEELEHAVNRGAKIYAEVIGYGASADAYHITAPVETGEGGIRAMKDAIRDAGIDIHDVDYINAHGTSTPLNDKTETKAIKAVFGDHAEKLCISSTKSMTGHTLGAASAIEAIVCCKTIQTGMIHPTINLEDPDPECDLNYVPNQAIQKDVTITLSNSLGFGGQNGVIILKKYK